MNIRKTLLLTLVIAIASLGLTLTGCEQKSDHPTGEHPATEAAPAEHPTEHPAAEETAEEAVDEAAAAAEEAVEEAADAVKEAVPTEHPE